MNGPHIALPVPLAQQLVDYLSKRPYAEVSQLIGGLVKAPQVQLADQSAPKEPEAKPT